MDIYIQTTAQARKLIGQRVYWDDVSNRYVFLRSGIVEEVCGYQICIDGNWHMRKNLTALRNFEKGGNWK